MKTIKKFSADECVYDSASKTRSKKLVEIGGDIIPINFQNIIDSQFCGGNIPGNYEDLKKNFGLGQFSSAPCGGFVNFMSVTSNEKSDFIIFSGVNEVENSHYVVTIHAILKDDDQSILLIHRITSESNHSNGEKCICKGKE